MGFLSEAAEGDEGGCEAECGADGVGSGGAEVVEEIEDGSLDGKPRGDEHGEEEERKADKSEAGFLEIIGSHQLVERPCTKERDDDAERVEEQDGGRADEIDGQACPPGEVG